MDFYEGQIFEGIYPPEAAKWCNEGGEFHIERVGDGVYSIIRNAQHEETEQERDAREHNELINALPDAIADLSQAVSDNTDNNADIMDALAELSEIVSNLMEGE